MKFPYIKIVFREIYFLLILLLRNKREAKTSVSFYYLIENDEKKHGATGFLARRG